MDRLFKVHVRDGVDLAGATAESLAFHSGGIALLVVLVGCVGAASQLAQRGICPTQWPLDQLLRRSLA